MKAVFIISIIFIIIISFCKSRIELKEDTLVTAAHVVAWSKSRIELKEASGICIGEESEGCKSRIELKVRVR